VKSNSGKSLGFYGIPTASNYCPSVLDTVGRVIGPIKIVPNMTYNVFGGTLNSTVYVLLPAGDAGI